MADSKSEQVNPEEHVVEGQSFYNAALTGAGTFTADGVVGPPTPDPTVIRGTVEPPRTRVSPETNQEDKPRRARRTKAEIEQSQAPAPPAPPAPAE